MRKSLILLVSAVSLLIAISAKARADVYAVSGIEYYAPTDSIWLWAEARPDYGTLANYCIGHVSDIYNGDDLVATINNQSCDSVAYDDVYLPYDANANYTIIVNPGLDLKHQGPDGFDYSDVDNFYVWQNYDSVYDPNYFTFTGPGPTHETWSKSISLGSIFSFFSQGFWAGPPHHLKVIHDETEIPMQPCVRAIKTIIYQIVDANNVPAGRVRFREAPVAPPFWDTCSNQYAIYSGACGDPSDSQGRFDDHQRTGCPNSGQPPDCGYDVLDRFQWCRRTGAWGGTTFQTLATVYYNVRRTYVEVDGALDIDDGSYKYP